MRHTLTLSLLLWFGAASASLVDNGSYTTDTDSGLDWLDLTATVGLSYSDAPASQAGWRYATNSEIEDIFGQLFVGYYDTNAQGTSNSNEGVYADQDEDILAFTNLFGPTYTSPDTGDPIAAYGFYTDEDNIIRIIGTYENKGPNVINEFNVVIGLEFTGTYTETETGVIGTFLVRPSIIPIPSAFILFASALAGLGWLRRLKTIAL